MSFTSTLPWWLIVLLATSLSVLVVLAVRKWMYCSLDKETLRKAHEVSSATYLNIGVLYGIVLGLVTVNGLERHADLQHAAEEEASSLLSISRISQLFPTESANAIRASVHDYAANVINVEWDDDESRSIHSEKHITLLWSELATIIKADSVIDGKEQELIARLNLLQERRMERLGLMKEKVNSMVWTILVAGAILMILFLVAFDPMSTALHTLLIIAVAGTISTILVLIFAFDHPTDGALRISPEAFKTAVKTIALPS